MIPDFNHKGEPMKDYMEIYGDGKLTKQRNKIMTTTNGEAPKEGGKLGLVFGLASIAVVIYIVYTLFTA